MPEENDKQNSVSDITEKAISDFTMIQEKRIFNALESMENDSLRNEYISRELSGIHKELERLRVTMTQVEASTDLYLKNWERDTGLFLDPAVEYPESVDIKADQMLYASNWYGVEHRDEMPFRWSGPMKMSAITFRVDRAETRKFQLHIVDVLNSKFLEEMEVYADGLKINSDLEQSESGELRLMCGILPATLQVMPTELTFVLSGISTPSEMGGNSKDTRPLGIAVSRLYVF